VGLGSHGHLPVSTEPAWTPSLCSLGPWWLEHPSFLGGDICEVHVVSRGRRPQFLASWHRDVLPLYGDSLATSQLQGGRDSAPSPSGPFLRPSLS